MSWQWFVNDHLKKTKEVGLKELVQNIWDEDEIHRQNKLEIAMTPQLKANVSEALAV